MDKNKNIIIRVSDKEKDVIKKKAKSLGVTISSYMISASLKRKVLTIVDKEAILQLRYIGNNINQIAHVLNADSSLQRISLTLDKLEHNISELENLVKIIRDNYDSSNSTDI